MKDRKENSKHRLDIAIEEDIALPLTISMRAYFSSYHLWAARAFSVEAGKIEASLSEAPRFDIAHRAYVNNSILAAVSFAEAAINEVYQDAADDHNAYIEKLSKEAVSTLADYWNMTEIKNKSHISTLDKYQLALRFSGAEPFGIDCPPYQDANLAITLRNTLVHYKPESISSKSNHKLSKQLRGKFEPCVLFKGAGNPFFPDHCLGHGCSEWVVDSVKGFADEFFARIGVKPNYQAVDFGSYELGKA